MPSTSSNELLLVLADLELDTAELWYALGLASGGTIPLEPFRRLLGGVARETNSADGALLVLLSGSDSPLVREQISLYQLAQDALAAKAITDWVESGVFGDGPPAGADPAGAAGFRARLRTHIERYGHQTSSLDFVEPCLAEQPDQILTALRCYQIPGARNPASVLHTFILRRTEAANRVSARLYRPRRAAFRRLLRRAQMHLLAREQLVFDLQRGWPLFRTILIDLGTRLVFARVLGSAEEVLPSNAMSFGVPSAAMAGPPRLGSGRASGTRSGWNAKPLGPQRISHPEMTPRGETPCDSRSTCIGSPIKRNAGRGSCGALQQAPVRFEQEHGCSPPQLSSPGWGQGRFWWPSPRPPIGPRCSPPPAPW